MAKTMAKIVGGTVANLLWCSDSAVDTDELKSTGDYLVEIGDAYSHGAWYRDGERLLSPLEQAQVLQSQMAELDAAYREGVNSL